MGDVDLNFYGVDLEDVVIDVVIIEWEVGNFLVKMIFVCYVDIGKLDSLFVVIWVNGDSTEGVIIMVGNGFYEVCN